MLPNTWTRILRSISSRSPRKLPKKAILRRTLRLENLEQRRLLSLTPTVTTLIAPAAPVIAGQALTLTATVTTSPPSGTTPTGGSVTFMDGNTTLGPATLISGIASLQCVSLPAGTQVLTAMYSGDNVNFAASTTTLEPNSIITTVAGNRSFGYSGDNGPATSAGLNGPTGIAVDAAQDLFIVDNANNVIREVNHASGVITTVAGNGTIGYSGDGGPATAAALNQAFGIAVDSAGDLFIVDQWNNRIREVNHATGVITTVAGNGTAGYSGDGGPATAAELNYPQGAVVDSAGDLFIADEMNSRIREVNHATGVITTVAGVGTPWYSGDGGPATAAELNAPRAVAVDSDGDLFIADSTNNVVREVNHATGVITTVAGNGTAGYSGDGGQATAAELKGPRGIAVDSAGDLFIDDCWNNVIREVDLATGVITTAAGNGYVITGNGRGGYSGDGGNATAAELNNPMGVAVDSAGDLFIADWANSVIRKVASGVGVRVLLDNTTSVTASPNPSVDGQPVTFTATVTPTQPGVGTPTGSVSFSEGGTLLGTRTLDAEGNATFNTTTLALGSHTITASYAGDANFIATSGSVAQVVKWYGTTTVVSAFPNPSVYGQPVTFAATVAAGQPGVGVPTGTVTFSDGGTLLGSAPLEDGVAIFTDSALEAGTHQLTVVYGGDNVNFAASTTTLGSNSIITTIAGGGIGDGLQATAAELNGPSDAAVDSAGDLFIADSNNNVVREVDHATGVITTVAGNGYGAGLGYGGYSGDGGTATAAELNGPSCVALDTSGDLLIADEGNNVIREVNFATGVITTVAGNGSAGYSGDGGAATAAELNNICGIAVDSTGDLFIADSNDNVVREVNHVTGVITTVAGNGIARYSGDGGQATEASLCNPRGIAVDSAGDLFIADADNNVVRKVNHATGVITTVAGNGTAGYSGDGGQATASELWGPSDVALDSAGDLFIVDVGNDVVREVNTTSNTIALPGGGDLAPGVITAIAGKGAYGYSGNNGPATAAELSLYSYSWSPLGVALDAAGDLFIADIGNNVVREVDHARAQSPPSRAEVWATADRPLAPP